MTTTRSSNFAAGLRTTMLMAGLGGMLVAIGYAVGGIGAATGFLGVALLFNLGMFWFSDKIALKMSGAQPLEEAQAPRIFAMTRELAENAGIPMPRMYVIPQEQPNAFATGRNPDNSAVAVTEGIVRLLDEGELRGVIAHELAHIRNRDTLTQTIAASIGSAITYLGYMMLWFRGDNNSPLGMIAPLAMVILAPIAAGVIQMAISRQREYSADATGAQICGNPEWLATALLKLEQGAKAMPMQVNQSAEPLYIVKPFSSAGLAGLFSTHPPIEERVARLRELRGV